MDQDFDRLVQMSPVTFWKICIALMSTGLILSLLMHSVINLSIIIVGIVTLYGGWRLYWRRNAYSTRYVKVGAVVAGLVMSAVGTAGILSLLSHSIDLATEGFSLLTLDGAVFGLVVLAFGDLSLIMICERWFKDYLNFDPKL